MTDFLESGVTWLNEVRSQHFVKTVTYRRGLSEFEIAATPAQTKTTIAGDEGIEIAGQVDDWIVSVSEMTLHGERVFPEEGDQIRETHGSQTFVFDVRKGPDGEAWRYTDAYRQTMRIHTVRTATDGG